MLIRGSLRTAAFVRWISAFLLITVGGSALLGPLLQPLDLTLTELQLKPADVALSAARIAVQLSLLVWLTAKLGKPSEPSESSTALSRWRDLLVPAGLGLALLLASFLVGHFLQGSEAASKAEEMARLQLGHGYQYHVSSLNLSLVNLGRGAAGHALVTAWNATQIREVPVAWSRR